LNQFVQEMTKASVPISPWDTKKNTLHHGTQLRSAGKSFCGLHVIIDPGGGQNGAPGRTISILSTQ
jgi:hypothetical protein